MILDIDVRDICGKYKEIVIKYDSVAVSVGTLNDEECKEIAKELIAAAQELLND